MLGIAGGGLLLAKCGGASGFTATFTVDLPITSG
jgi:hypothetical protein